MARISFVLLFLLLPISSIAIPHKALSGRSHTEQLDQGEVAISTVSFSLLSTGRLTDVIDQQRDDKSRMSRLISKAKECIYRRSLFDFWPIHRRNEYNDNHDANRAESGDDQVIVELSPSPASKYRNDLESKEAYWLIGERKTVATIINFLLKVNPIDKLSSDCGVGNTSSLFPFESTNSSIDYPNVAQWYRTPSYTLAYETQYNTSNLLPLNGTSQRAWVDSIHFPEQQSHPPFLDCLNKTISAAFSAGKDEGSSVGKLGIAGIVLFSILCFVSILSCCVFRRIKDISFNIRMRACRRGSIDSPSTYGEPWEAYCSDWQGRPFHDSSDSLLPISQSMRRANTGLGRRYYSRRISNARRSLDRNETIRDRRWSSNSTLSSIVVPPLAHVRGM